MGLGGVKYGLRVYWFKGPGVDREIEENKMKKVNEGEGCRIMVKRGNDYVENVE